MVVDFHPDQALAMSRLVEGRALDMVSVSHVAYALLVTLYLADGTHEQHTISPAGDVRPVPAAFRVCSDHEGVA